MREIGGYFELELPEGDSFLHSSGILVNSGRHALEYLLLSLGDRVRGVVLPYYTCDAVLQPIERLGIAKRFYHIDANLSISSLPQLNDGEIIIVNNFFGVCDEGVSHLVQRYRNRIVVDNAQAWYAKEETGSYGIYSPRKYFGIPDGGIVTGLAASSLLLEQDYSSDRCRHLLKRIDEGAASGYGDFKEVSKQISTAPLKSMSNLTIKILRSINYEKIRKIRRANYSILSESLGDMNPIRLPSMNSFSCPMVYPFFSSSSGLRKHLIENKIFVATYWPNVLDWCSHDSEENLLARSLLPLPIDQRYGEEEMNHIVKLIKEYR